MFIMTENGWRDLFPPMAPVPSYVSEEEAEKREQRRVVFENLLRRR